MTVASDLNKQDFVGDGSTVAFPFNIQANDISWIIGQVDKATQTGTTALNADQEASPGGTFTFDVAPANMSRVTILRFVPLDQLLDLPDFTPFPARNVEDSLDKVTMALAQFFNAITGGNISGPLIMDNNIPIMFANVDESVDPNDLGVYRLINTAANEWNIDTSDGAGGWVTLVEVVNGIWNFPVIARTSVIPSDVSDLVNKLYSDTGDAALESAKVNRSGDTMTGDLFVPLEPTTGSSATSRFFVETLIEGIFGGLQFKGFWDASGGLLPASPDNGDFYIIAVGGILNVSDGINPPTPTMVNPGDTITFDGDTGFWVGIVATSTALGTSFVPTGTNYTETNVQAALVEADSRMFVHADDNVAETINGVKRFTTQLKVTTNIPFDLEGVNTIGASGDCRQRTNNSDITTFEKRNQAGTVWLPVMQILDDGQLQLDSVVNFITNFNVANSQTFNFRNNLGEINNSGAHRIFQSGGDDWAIQTNILGVWRSAINVDSTNSTVMFDLNGAVTARFEPVGSTSTSAQGVITQEKGDARYGTLDGGNTWNDLQTFTAERRMHNGTPTQFLNQSNFADSNGSKRILIDVINSLRLQHNNGGVWQDGIEIDGNGQTKLYDLNGTLTANFELAGTSTPNSTGVITRNKGDARYGQLGVSNNWGVGINTFEDVHIRNNDDLIFLNTTDFAAALGAKRLINTTGNDLSIQHHNGGAFQNAIEITSSGLTVIYGVNGIATAIFDIAGSGVTAVTSVITREKGDARYAELAGADFTGSVGIGEFGSDVTIPLVVDNNNVASEAVCFELRCGLSSTAAIRIRGNTNQQILDFDATGDMNWSSTAIPSLSINGVQAALLAAAGTVVNSSQNIITREKGDARYAPISDATLKTDIEAAVDCLSIVNQFKPVTYQWKDDPRIIPDDKEHYGLLAQDVEKVVEGAVADLGDMKALNTTDLIGLLVGAVQELSAEVAALKEK